MRCRKLLSQQQKAAVNHHLGPALVLAVPGAGKTTVLIHRTANLIQNYKIDPRNILSITFSRASANDMKARFISEFPDLSKGINFSTIHSFCFNLVREYSYIAKVRYTLIEDGRNEVNKYNILRNIYSEVNGSRITEDKLETLLNLIGYMKNMMISPREYIKHNRVDIKNFPLIFEAYEKYKVDNNLIDFDDMLTLSYRILRTNDSLLKKYQNIYSFIQVDEGQDTSKIQLEIIKLIAKPDNNLFIVADDDQSIYGFRGAYPRGLFNFSEEYEEAKIFFMEENYRSSKNIVSASNKLIHNNSIRFDKTIFTNNNFIEPINIVKLSSLNQQYRFILDDLKEKSFKDSCVLYRNNISAIGLIDFFDRNNIPFIIKDRNLRFFNHWIVGDIINFLRFAEDTSRISVYEKIFYKKKGYISRKQINYAKKLNNNLSVFDRIKDFPGISDFYKKNLNRLKLDFKKISKLSPTEAIDYIKYDLEYRNYLKEYSTKFGYTFRSLLQILTYLSLISRGTKNLDEFIARLNHLQNLSRKSSNNTEGITLSTIHSAKGLEFDNVYMIDLIDGDFPSLSSIEDFQNGKEESLEEERRLFYVAMTRARYYLSLILVDWIDNSKIEYSRFIEDLS